MKMSSFNDEGLHDNLLNMLNGDISFCLCAIRDQYYDMPYLFKLYELNTLNTLYF